MIITDLPIETLEHIVAAIDSPTHLRNLATVCTQLRSIVEPYHTQFRVIRAPLTSPIWRKLAENQLLAQNVRTLEVQPEDANIDDQVIPTIFPNLEVPSVPVDISEDIEGHYAAKNAMDLDAERVLVSALKEMSGLASFQWSRTPPLINRNRGDDIWITLANHCPSLNVVYVIDREKPWKHLRKEPDDLPSQRPSCNPNDLKSFSLTIDASDVVYVLWPEIEMEQCAKMLVERCPNLEVLNLSFTNFNTTLSVSHLLSGPPWNSLRELSLFGCDFISTELSSHLASHPTIEALSLCCFQIDRSLVLPPHTLPRLKHLSIDSGPKVANSVLDSTIAIPRPLKYIKCPLLDDVFLDSLEQCGSGPNLDELVTLYNGASGDLGRLITRLSGIAPNLESLEIRVRGQEIDPTLYPIFGQFSHLRTLRGMQFISSSCVPASENTERIRVLASLCPNVWRIDNNWYVGIVIERNGSHGTWSLHGMGRGRQFEGVYNMLWGERGQGSFEL